MIYTQLYEAGLIESPSFSFLLTNQSKQGSQIIFGGYADNYSEEDFTFHEINGDLFWFFIL
jgi:Eukaryotic aspartyl protease